MSRLIATLLPLTFSISSSKGTQRVRLCHVYGFARTKERAEKEGHLCVILNRRAYLDVAVSKEKGRTNVIFLGSTS